MTDAEVRRIVLSTLPLTVLSTAGVVLAVHGLWILSVVVLGAAAGYFVWMQLWRRNREADEALERATQHESAEVRGAADVESP